MIRVLCPVCNTPQPLTQHGRLAAHRRKAESPLLRAQGIRSGVPCEGTGRLPLRTCPQGGISRRKEDATP